MGIQTHPFLNALNYLAFLVYVFGQQVRLRLGGVDGGATKRAMSDQHSWRRFGLWDAPAGVHDTALAGSVTTAETIA